MKKENIRAKENEGSRGKIQKFYLQQASTRVEKAL
jgi:hypothetical protein